jgi:hypothetical protein
MRNFIICTHSQIPLGKSSQVKANEVGGSCGTHGRGEKSVGFCGKARMKQSQIHNRNENVFKFKLLKPKLV